MTYTLVSANTNISTVAAPPLVLTCTSTTAHNLLVCVVGIAVGTANVTSLPAGWVQAVLFNTGNAAETSIWYYPDCPAGITSVNVSWTGAQGLGMAGQILEFHDSVGTNATPLDVTGTSSGASTPVAIATGSATTTASELAVAGYTGTYASATKDTLAAGTGFTQAGQYGAGVKQTTHIAFDYKLNTGATGTQTDSMTFTGPFSGHAGVIATFKDASVVRVDAVGPSSAGAYGTASPITWSHTNSAAGNAICVGVNYTTGSSPTTTAVTYGGVALARLASHTGGTGGSGGIELWGKIGSLPTGANTVSVTATGVNTTTGVAGGSVSFTGAGAFGTAVTAASAGTATSITANVTGTTVGNQIMAVASYGNSAGAFSTTSPGTQQFAKNGDSNSGADNTVGGTWASPGGTQAVGFSATIADFWGLAAVEVQPAGAAAGLLSQQLKHRAPALWTRITHPGAGASYTR